MPVALISYPGAKTKLLPQILPHSPADILHFRFQVLLIPTPPRVPVSSGPVWWPVDELAVTMGGRIKALDGAFTHGPKLRLQLRVKVSAE
jgi:hypothetical protein